MGKIILKLTSKVEERACLVINCAGNEGDTVEKMAGNIPKVCEEILLRKWQEIFQRFVRKCGENIETE